jgi:hypothetical protein
MPKLVKNENQRKKSVTFSLSLETITVINHLATTHDRSGSWVVEKSIQALELLYNQVPGTGGKKYDHTRTRKPT